MKKYLFLILILGIIGCENDEQFTINCLPNNLQSGVIAFYPFNAGNLDDDSANSNNLTNPTTAIPSSDRNGNSSCAYKFDNAQTTEEFLTTTNSGFLNNLDEFSISLWYQPMNSTIMGTTVQGMFSRGNVSQCPNRMGEWSMSLFDCRKAVFGHNNSVWANPDTTDCQAQVDILVDKWHHVVGVKNGNEYKIYFDGILNETKTGDAGCSNFQSAQDFGDVFVGFEFTGKIDDIILYNREITASEVTELFTLESCCE